jgi:peroxiredoxin (alkyl hydroperoxide reductase subunit C)
MAAWGREQKVGDNILMLADGNCTFTRALGLEVDMSAAGFGMRSRRFALVAEEGIVTYIAVEPDRTLDVSAAEKILQVLAI